MSTRVEVIHVQGIASTRSLILSFGCFVYELLKHEVQMFENRNINNTGLNSATLFTNYQVQKFRTKTELYLNSQCLTFELSP